MKTLLFHNYRTQRFVYQNNGETPKVVEAVNIVSEKPDITLKELEKQDMNDSNVREKLYEKVAQKVEDLKDDGKTEAAERLSTKLQVARDNENAKNKLETSENIAQQLLARLLSIARKEASQFALFKKAPSGNKMSDAQAAAVKNKLDSTFVPGKDEVKPNSPAEKVAVTPANPLKIALNNEGKQMKEAITSSGTLTKEVVSAPSSAPAIPKKV